MATSPRAPNPRQSRSYIKAHAHGETPDKKPAHLYAEHKDGRVVRMWITAGLLHSHDNVKLELVKTKKMGGCRKPNALI